MNDLSRLNADSTSVPAGTEGTAPQEGPKKELPPEKRLAAVDSWELAAASPSSVAPSSLEPDSSAIAQTELPAAIEPQHDTQTPVQVEAKTEKAEAENTEAAYPEVPVDIGQAQASEPADANPVFEVDNAYNCARVVGARLAQLREEKNWLLDDVSAQLKVPVSKLRALEAGEVSVLPDAAFTLGLVRAYSKMLGIDPTPFIEELRSAKGPLKEALANLGMHRELLSKHVLDTPSLVRSKWAVLKQQRKRVIALVGLGVACLAIAGLLLFGHREASLKSVSNEAQTASTASNTETEGLPTPAQLSAPPVLPANQSSVPANVAPAATPIAHGAAVAPAAPASVVKVSSDIAPTVPAPTASSIIEPRQSAPLAATEVPAPATIPPAAPAATQPLAAAAAISANSALAPSQIASASSEGGRVAIIHFRVSQDNWISVSQADGKLLYAGLLKAGSERNVRGIVPFKVTAGSKTGLDAVTLDGKPIDLSQYLASKQDVVRFDLR